MNLDNQRLAAIKRALSVYYYKLDKADSISECIDIKEKIDELEKEEKQILERCDVRI